MSSDKPLLYQFPISHFCEKARWALEYKGIDYTLVNLLPGPHQAVISKLAEKTSVPVLVVGDEVIQGSPEIISWLDRYYPDRPLTPTNTTDASMAMEWERSADSNLGVTLRRFFYYHVLPDRSLSIRLLSEGASFWGRSLFQLIFPLVRTRMREAMNINAEAAASAQLQMEKTLDYLDERLAKHRFLAGPLFSRADLAVSALLAPTWRGIEGLPPAVTELIEKHHSRPALQWAQAVYQDYRHINAA